MATQNNREFSITANGLSAWTALPPGLTKVWIQYTSGAAGVVKPKVTHTPDDADAIFPVELGGVEVTASANRVFDVNGLAWMAFDVSGISGTIKIRFSSAAVLR